MKQHRIWYPDVKSLKYPASNPRILDAQNQPIRIWPPLNRQFLQAGQTVRNTLAFAQIESCWTRVIFFLRMSFKTGEKRYLTSLV